MAQKRSFLFGNSQLTIEFDDITTSTAQVLVSSDDYYLSMGGGVSASLLRAGGNAIAIDAAKKVPANLGDVVVTTAGSLPAQYIFHAITIGPGSAVPSSTDLIRKITGRCLHMLDSLQLNSIAFPTIGAGKAGFSYEDVAVEMADVISNDLQDRDNPIDVTIYIFDSYGWNTEMDFIRYFDEFAARVPRLSMKSKAATPYKKEQLKKIFPARFVESSSTEVIETDEQIKMQRLNNLRKLIASLEDKRYELEASLIELINGDEEDERQRIRNKLNENQELRLSFLNEIQSLTKKGSEALSTASSEKLRPISVFVSSTYKDLIDHRSAVKEQIMRRDMFFRGMETFGAEPGQLTPAVIIVEEVRKADAYIGIFGVRYGYIDPVSGLSMTELEFNEAVANKKPMLLYVMRDDAPVKRSDIEPDANGKTKLDSLIDRILKQYMVYRFDTVANLARQVYEDLGKL